MEYILIKNGVHPNNTYLIHQNNKCLIIDPSSGLEQIINEIECNNLIPIAILLTHGHYDHIYSVDMLVDQYNIDVYCSDDTAKALIDSELNVSKTSENALYEFIVRTKPNIIRESCLQIEKFNIKVIFNPGHSLGCTSFLINNLCFTGDFIFKKRVGRTDLLDSDKILMQNSLLNFRNLILNSASFHILPGHGQSTTSNLELAENPHLHL